MAISTKVIELDGAGAGSVHIPPCYFTGGHGFTTATNHGDNLGTALLTKATAQFVHGEIDVYGGTADGEATLFFDIN